MNARKLPGWRGREDSVHAAQSHKHLDGLEAGLTLPASKPLGYNPTPVQLGSMMPVPIRQKL